jgi:cyclic-di-GMP-binding biofilm dispersal mediator protein
MRTHAGRKAMVLGGSRGIGAAIVERLALEGARVTFSYFGSQAAAEALAERTGAKAVRADSADRRAVAAAIREAGPLDVLVVNAGLSVYAPATEFDPDTADRMIDVNLRGPWHAAVAAARTMPEGGRIVFIGSTGADRMPIPGGSVYALTKAGVQGMVRGLARDLGPRNITVNAVQPGPTDTDMNPADGPDRETMHAFMAIKRHATPAEIAGMVAYLTGPDAGIVTGAMHTIDGGFAA